MKIVMTEFAKRQFKYDFTGTKILWLPLTFEHHVNDLVNISNLYELQDGYAPFCKHLFVPNFVGAYCGTVKITPDNEKYLKSGYITRREGELPVLCRWFDSKDLILDKAEWLDIILYDKEQLEKEKGIIDGDYGIVSINAVRFNKEEPMTPMTMMRNALGINEGGSGVALDKDKYNEAVEFWNQYAILK